MAADYTGKDIVTALGSAAGVYSFVRLVFGDIRNRFTRPHLSIEFNLPDDLREWGVHGAARKQKVATVHVRNKRRTPALECAAVLRVISEPLGVTVGEREYSLHWADTDYTMHSNVAAHVDIGLERRRLDVVFTVLPDRKASPEGAWVAIPMALAAPDHATQARLPPGEYRFRLTVACSNGNSTSREFTVNSPKDWSALSMRSG
jgi:hypothetical protein